MVLTVAACAAALGSGGCNLVRRDEVRFDGRVSFQDLTVEDSKQEAVQQNSTLPRNFSLGGPGNCSPVADDVNVPVQVLTTDMLPKATSVDPLLQYGVRTRVDGGPQHPTALQDQVWRRMKVGTRKQMQAKRSEASTVLRHGISARRVRQGLDNSREVHAMQHELEKVATKMDSHGSSPLQLARRLLSGSPRGPLLIEWCCSSTSEISRVWSRVGPSFRVALPAWNAEAKDTNELLSALISAALAQGRQVRVWASQECKSWCSWHRVFGMPRPQLLAQRAISRRLTGLFLKLIEPHVGKTGFEVAWEWPRYCDGWNPQLNPPIARLLKLLGHTAKVDGCAYGLMDKNNIPVKKPWRIATTSTALARGLERLCPGHSRHTAARGKLLSSTELYTPEMTKNIVRYFVSGSVPQTLLVQIQQNHHEVLAGERHRAEVAPDGTVRHEVSGPQDDVESPELTRAVSRLHVDLAHPANDALARAIRLAGGTDAAIKTALKLRCAVCDRLREPATVPKASLRKWKEFGECVAIDLFSLGDSKGNTATFLNMLDMASRYSVVFPVADKNPVTVFYGFLMGWCMNLGIPQNCRFDMGGEFEAGFAEMTEQIGSRLLPCAAVSPTQNAPCERAGATWKFHAKRLCDQFSITWTSPEEKLWLCAVLNWATNAQVNETGYSSSQWVLGKSLRLPYQMLQKSSALAAHQRHTDDFSFQRRVAMLSAAQSSIISSRYSRALSRAFLGRARASDNVTSKIRFNIGDQVMFWRGNNKNKRQWAMRWVGPGIIIGHEGDSNVWISYRNTVIKAAGNHVRSAEFEEQVPWHDLFDQLAALDGTENHDYYDMTPPGNSRDAKSDGRTLPPPAVPPRMPGHQAQHDDMRDTTR